MELVSTTAKKQGHLYIYLLHVQPDLSYPGPFVAGPFTTGPFATGPSATGPFEDGRFVGISLKGLIPCVH
jgi:hypothetical protein